MNVIILGGGIAGLLAAHVFRRYQPILLESAPKLGGNFTAGGLKYIRHTPAFSALLRELDIPWTAHTPVGLLYLHGLIHEHPAWLKSLDAPQREDVQRAHWRRTRRTDAGFRGDCMNDPTGNGTDMAMNCDHAELITRLAARAELARMSMNITGITRDTVSIDGVRIPYDVLIPTIPLGALARLAPWAGLPKLTAKPLGIINLNNDGRQPSWDYMYNPFGAFTRATWPAPGLFQFEVPLPGDFVPGAEVSIDVERDVFEDATQAMGQFTNQLSMAAGPYKQIPGHLEPPEVPIIWPENWIPLGRFTQWEPRATAERVLNTAIAACAALS